MDCTVQDENLLRLFYLPMASAVALQQKLPCCNECRGEAQTGIEHRVSHSATTSGEIGGALIPRHEQGDAWPMRVGPSHSRRHRTNAAQQTSSDVSHLRYLPFNTHYAGCALKTCDTTDCHWQAPCVRAQKGAGGGVAGRNWQGSSGERISHIG